MIAQISKIIHKEIIMHFSSPRKIRPFVFADLLDDRVEPMAKRFQLVQTQVMSILVYFKSFIYERLIDIWTHE
jgi:hypothetical protein